MAFLISICPSGCKKIRERKKETGFTSHPREQEVGKEVARKRDWGCEIFAGIVGGVRRCVAGSVWVGGIDIIMFCLP